jgi:acyl carrier protein
MSEVEIFEAMRAVAREQLDLEIEPGAELDRDLALDSMSATTLIVAIEDRFRICLPDAELATVRRVSDLVDLVARRLAC